MDSSPEAKQTNKQTVHSVYKLCAIYAMRLSISHFSLQIFPILQNVVTTLVWRSLCLDDGGKGPAGGGRGVRGVGQVGWASRGDGCRVHQV